MPTLTILLDARWEGGGMSKVLCAHRMAGFTVVKAAVSAVGETRDKLVDRRQLDSLRQTSAHGQVVCQRQNWIFGASHGSQQIASFACPMWDWPGPAS
jgi:hypothetical protein